MSNESESKTKYCYYVSVDKTFGDSDDIHDYILGAWEDKMPASTAKYWSGHGQSFRPRKAKGFQWILAKLRRSMRGKFSITSYDVGFTADTLEEATNVFKSLQYLTKEDRVSLRLSVYPNDEEE
tara:strand:- start:2377 stop:2748 length:372 start_codon:yes stop_codon:yes gene_type:complete